MALSRDFPRPHKMNAGGLTTRKIGLGGVADTIYKGAILAVDVSVADGYAITYPPTLTAATGDFIAGIALEHVVVDSGDSNGDKQVLVAVDGVWAFPIGAITVANLGDAVYANDDGTITLTAGTEIQLGVLVGVDANYAWVDISKHTFVQV